MDSFQQTIRRSRYRVISARLLGAFSDLVVFGLLSFIAFGTWAQSSSLGDSAWTIFFILFGLVAAGYLAWEVSRGTSLRAVAIRLDRELGFQDRVSSALEFSSLDKPSGFMRAHLRETASFLEQNAHRAIAVPWPARIRAFAVFLCIGLVALLPHSDRTFLSQMDRRHKQEVRREAVRDIVRELGQLRKRADLHGLTKLSEMVAQAEDAFEEELSLLEPEPPAPEEDENPPQSDGAMDNSQDKSAADAPKVDSGMARSGAPGNNLQLSQVASYQPTGKFDSYPKESYAEVFGEIDKAVLRDDMFSAAELTNLAEHVDHIGGKISNFAFMDYEKATGFEVRQRSEEGQEMMDQNNSIERAIRPLQQKAFSEFLKRYSSHLGEKALGAAHIEKRALDKAKSGEVMNISAPPPKDAKFAVQGVGDQPTMPLMGGTDEQMAQIAAQTMMQGESSGQEMNQNAVKVQGGGTQLGGRGAGMGAAGQRGAAPKMLPRAAGGEYLPLEGKLADGESVIEVIDAQCRRKLNSGQSSKVSYQEVFVEYAKGAQAELNSEQVPLHMRDYIRDYFRSIRPKAKTKPKAKTMPKAKPEGSLPDGAPPSGPDEKPAGQAKKGTP